ncbi:MAG: WGR domain-containing protein [Pseudomonadota bacterium]
MLFACHLEARLPEANLSRAYRVMVLRDLFGLYTVEVTFGRIGRPGSTRRYTVATLDAARSKLKEVLKRRLTAPKRIAVAYVCRGAFDPQDWMVQDSLGFTSLLAKE